MEERIQTIALWALPILAAVVFHEVAHGYVARLLGDSTAERAGRLTLNPLAHVDPVGTVIVPLFLVLTNAGFFFGWARPVPVNYAALNNPRRDMILVAAAGPATNFVMAVAAALAFHALRPLAIDESGALSRGVYYPLAMMAQYAVVMNVFLGVFNLLPIPPLDGGRVLGGLLPPHLAQGFARIEPFGFLILIGLMMTHMLGVLVGPPVERLLNLLL